MAQIIDKQMSATEIIRKDLERGGFTKQEEKFLKGLALLIKQEKAVVVRHNNTVFVGIRKEPGVLEVHMYTLDTPNMLLGAMKVGIDAVKKAGVKKLLIETECLTASTTRPCRYYCKSGSDCCSSCYWRNIVVCYSCLYCS